MQLRVATCLTLPEPDVDEQPLAEALARAGFEATLFPWDDPTADWSSPIPTILRSTWNYALDVDRFLHWVDRVAKVAPLFNPPAIVRGNVFKRYLLELAARGVPVVPTTLVERGATCELAALPWQQLVLKPEVGAGSLGAATFDRTDPAAAAHLARLTARGAALVQPYLSSVEDYGERSLVVIDGELSHAIRKAPRFAGDSESITGPYAIAHDERAVALAALAPYPDLLYARCDLARDASGQPMIMELELVEPSLFFAKQPGSADRYARALYRRLVALG